MRKTKEQRRKEGKAIVIALVAAFLATAAAGVAATVWDKPRHWVPILAGTGIGILVYALLAPDS